MDSPPTRSVRIALFVTGLVVFTVVAPGIAVAETGTSTAVVGTGLPPANHDNAGCAFPVTETDTTGTEVTLEEPAEEVVVLDASSAQVFWEIGAEDRVTGMPVEEFTAYLEGSQNRTDVTDGQQVLVERVVELEPDLVVAPNYLDEETMTQLRDAGLTVYQLGLEDSFEAIYTKTALYGHFVGECDAATETVEETREDVRAVEEAVAGRERPRVLYFFFGFVAGNGTFIHDVVETAGGQNVAAEAGIGGYAEISEEVVVERDPEWIVAPSHAGFPEGEPYASTTAFESNQTLVVDENLISQAGPRVVVPLRQMAETFHPEAFESSEETTPPETPEDGPPLDSLPILALVVVGIVVLAALAAVVRSRR